jgi:3-oxoacyl-(acyl-carrier-protein) synthase
VKVGRDSDKNTLGIKETGEGYEKVIHKCNNISNIDYINPHDTGTRDNECEKIVTDKLFPGVPLLSYKKRIGHTLGTSSNIELGMVIQEGYKGTILGLSAGMGNVFSATILEIF